VFEELTPTEAGRLDSVLCGALHDAADDIWDEIADVVTNDLRAECVYMPPETNDFRLPTRQQVDEA
jgi:hypothetical protein